MSETVRVKIVATYEAEVPYDEEHYKRFADEGGLMSKDEVLEFEKEQAIEVLRYVDEDNVKVETTVTFHDTITKADL